MIQQSLAIEDPEPQAKMSAAEVVAVLRQRYTKWGNGGAGEFAFLEQVRDAAAWDAFGAVDVVVVSLWPSRGLRIEAIEVKVSRSDWRRELRNPSKAEPICQAVDQFWVAAPRGVIPADEVPKTWGLIEIHEGKRGRIAKVRLKAVDLHGGRTRSRPVSRDFLVGMLRACPGAIPGHARLDPNVEAIRLAREQERTTLREEFERQAQEWRDRANRAEEAIREFERRAGVALNYWSHAGAPPERIAQIAAAVRAAIDGDREIERRQKDLADMAYRLRRAADDLEAMSGVRMVPE